MPTIRIAPDLEMNYVVDDYTDPWSTPETILLLHGVHDSGAVWFGWVPHLARHYRVVRPDMRGFGASTPMPRDYVWSLNGIIDDFTTLMQSLAIDRFHLVGAKLGATVARRFAARHPERIQSLTVVGAPPPNYRSKRVSDADEKPGIDSWTAATMSARLGSRFPPEAVAWWTTMMARTAASTLIGFRATIPTTDITSDLPNIQCPTLVITTEGSALGSVQATRAWQQTIPNSRLLVLPGDSYHVAASDADRCALATFEFISSVRTS